MTESKKSCPFCGAEINEKAKKCRFCNNWIVEEIECPFCAETIKANAKKCRFCGEWLSENNLESNGENKKLNFKFAFKSFNVNNPVLISSIIAGILVILALCFFITYIPSCKSNYVIKKVSENVKSKFPEITNFVLDKSSISNISTNSDGHTCKVSAFADDEPLNIEFTYNKVSLNNYNFNTKVILPDCYDPTLKSMLSKLIQKQDYLRIRELTSDVEIDKATVVDYDKDTPSYMCSAAATLTAKPGQAYVLNWWNFADAEKKITCSVEYKSLFCGNGFTSCVKLNDIDNCSYKEE